MSKYTKQWAIDNGWAPADAGAFARFMRVTNKILLDELGLHIEDLPDYDYASAFMRGMMEHEVVDDILEVENICISDFNGGEFYK